MLPGIIDPSIAVPPPDYVGYKRSDNSVTVGLNLDFSLWQRSTELERVGLLADNIHHSLDRIESHFLVDSDRESLHQIVEEVQAQFGSRH